MKKNSIDYGRYITFKEKLKNDKISSKNKIISECIWKGDSAIGLVDAYYSEQEISGKEEVQIRVYKGGFFYAGNWRGKPNEIENFSTKAIQTSEEKPIEVKPFISSDGDSSDEESKQKHHKKKGGHMSNKYAANELVTQVKNKISDFRVDKNKLKFFKEDLDKGNTRNSVKEAIRWINEDTAPFKARIEREGLETAALIAKEQAHQIALEQAHNQRIAKEQAAQKEHELNTKKIDLEIAKENSKEAPKKLIKIEKKLNVEKQKLYEAEQKQEQTEKILKVATLEIKNNKEYIIKQEKEAREDRERHKAELNKKEEARGEALYNAGGSLYQLGDYAEAYKKLEEALKICNPDVKQEITSKLKNTIDNMKIVEEINALKKQAQETGNVDKFYEAKQKALKISENPPEKIQKIIKEIDQNSKILVKNIVNQTINDISTLLKSNKFADAEKKFEDNLKLFDKHQDQQSIFNEEIKQFTKAFYSIQEGYELFNTAKQETKLMSKNVFAFRKTEGNAKQAISKLDKIDQAFKDCKKLFAEGEKLNIGGVVNKLFQENIKEVTEYDNEWQYTYNDFMKNLTDLDNSSFFNDDVSSIGDKSEYMQYLG